MVWERQLRGKLSGPYPDNLLVEANGAILSVFYTDEDQGEYLVLDPEGGVVFKEILGGQVGLALSPGGKYYYQRFQGAKRLELGIVSGGTRQVILPAPSAEQAEEITLPISVGFVAPDRLLAVMFLKGQPPRKYLFDLRRDPATYLELAPDSPISPIISYSFQAGMVADGKVLHVDEFEFMGPGSGISCFSTDGRILWRQKLNITPRWVIAASDRSAAALLDSNKFGIIDTASGSLLASGKLPGDFVWIYEASFTKGRVLASCQGGLSGNDQLMAEIRIDENGAILASRVEEVHAWGIGEDRPNGGIGMPGAGVGEWMAVGFQK